MSTALIIRDDSKLSAYFSQEAERLKCDALEKGALIGRVDSAESQSIAVSAQQEIHSLVILAEKARKAAKEPVLDFGSKIDAAAKAFMADLKDEELRIATAVADFQALEQARVRAAEQARNEALTKLERDKAQEITQAKSHEQVEAIQERYNQEAQSIPIAAPIRAEGQRVREVWDIQVTDIWTLARAHPMCVKIEPRLSEIQNLLDAGVKVAGVTATRQIKAGVQAGRVSKLIEV